MRRALISLLTIWILAAPAHVLLAQEPPAPERDLDIRLLRGNLYGVRDGEAHTVFLATRDGILVVDPLNRPAAAALKQQLDARFPGVPVRYVVLTHHHADRAAGAGTFENAQIVAEAEFNEQLSRSRRSNDAVYRFVRDVRDTFHDARTITLGDSSVQLVHIRSTHAPEMTVVYFASEKVLFAVAPPPVTAVPFTFDVARPRDVLTWIDAVSALGPDLLLFDDGKTMEGAAFRQLALYLRTIRSEVAAAYERGRTVGDILAASSPAGQTAVAHDTARPSQVAAVYDSVRLLRIDLSGRAIATYTSRNPSALCDGRFTVCSAGGAIPDGVGAITITPGNRFGVVVEGTFGAQLWGARSYSGFQDETALRLSRAAALFRFGAPRPGRSAYVPVAGVSQTRGSVRGLSHVVGVLTPVGGYHQIESRQTRTGVTVGVDLVKTRSRGFSIIAPVRLTRLIGERPEYWPSTFDVQAGIGISVPIIRRISLD